jgi:membrane protein
MFFKMLKFFVNFSARLVKLKKLYGLLKNAFLQLKGNEPLILASATAFFTLFSLTPILVILVNILSILFRNNKITGALFQPMKKYLGEKLLNKYNLLLKMLNRMAAIGI